MGGKQSRHKKSNKKSSISEKRASDKKKSSDKKSSQENQRSSRRNTSTKSKEKKKCSVSVPASVERVGASLLSEIGIIRRQKSGAVQVYTISMFTKKTNFKFG
jgi:hypothetical protein